MRRPRSIPRQALVLQTKLAWVDSSDDNANIIFPIEHGAANHMNSMGKYAGLRHRVQSQAVARESPGLNRSSVAA
jgi:hypothetical protein